MKILITGIYLQNKCVYIIFYCVFFFNNFKFSKRKQWISYLENLYKNELPEKERITLKPHSELLRSMVRQGIPHSLRPQLWMRFSGT